MIKDTREDHLNKMNDRDTFERLKKELNLTMKRPKIKESIVELKSKMRKFELTGKEEEFFDQTDSFGDQLESMQKYFYFTKKEIIEAERRI